MKSPAVSRPRIQKDNSSRSTPNMLLFRLMRDAMLGVIRYQRGKCCWVGCMGFEQSWL